MSESIALHRRLLTLVCVALVLVEGVFAIIVLFPLVSRVVAWGVLEV